MAKVIVELKKQVFDVAQAQPEPDVHHGHESDHLRPGVEIAKRAVGFDTDDATAAGHAFVRPAHPFGGTMWTALAGIMLVRVSLCQSI